MTDDFEKYFGFGTREERAARLDNAAIADPTEHSADEVALGELLADILSYEPKDAAKHARWLLKRCSYDYSWLRPMIVAMRERGELDWVQLKQVNVYQLRAVLAEEYQLQWQAQEEREQANTTKGRRQRYASYPGILS